ncbi:MAG: hypothetical protein Q3999_03970 [Buchananella hordeovulneris]|nr:hypothetical protein [Buchananella hordeovulneris]
MQYISIAPLVDPINGSVKSELPVYAEDNKENTQLRSQRDYHVIDLAQRFYSLKTITLQGVSNAQNFLATTSHGDYVVSIADITDLKFAQNDHTLSGSEACFSDIIDAVILTNFKQNLEYRWVNRTIVVTNEESSAVTEGWLGRGIERYEYRAAHSKNNTVKYDLEISWGNNLITVQCQHYDNDTIFDYIKGVIDAQSIWINYSRVTEGVREIAQNMNHGEFDSTKYKTLRDKLLAMSKKRSLLNLVLDEVETSLQGLRYHAVTMCLQAWNLDSVKSRLATNLEILESINSQNHKIARSKEQSKVDLFLLTLSILTLTQFLLTFTDLSFSGGVDAIPGQGPYSFGLMNWIRSMGMDAWVSISLVITAITAVIIFRKNGK